MSKEKTYISLSETYRRSWESCLALWPILIFRLVFVLLNLGAILLCFFLVCWPLVKTVWKAFRDSGNGNLPNFIQGMDFSSYIPDLRWILMAVGVGLIFITWWSLLDAFFDGAVYARLRDHQENGRFFSFSEFFKDGMRYMGPMIGLQMVWFLILMGILLVGVLLALFAAVTMNVFSIPWWVWLLSGIPAGFIGLLLFIGMAAYGVLAGAYLMEGKGVLNALKKSFHKCLQGYGRAVWSFFLVWVIYFVFSIAFQAVMGIFGHIPLLGFIFIIFEFLVDLTLSIVIWVFMPALAVTFSLEEEC